MNKLSEYKTLKEKSTCFLNGNYNKWFKIETKADFGEWYAAIKKHTDSSHFFRGVSEAKFKLYASAQRNWVEQLRKDSGKKYYRTFFKELIGYAREQPLLRKVMDHYKLDRDENTFSFMSLLQHYRGITPFLDWTYNMDIALFFAMGKPGNYKGSGIKDYSSIYWIDNNLAKIKLLRSGEYKDFHKMLEDNKTGEGMTKETDKRSLTRLRFLADSNLPGNITDAERMKPYSLSVFNQHIITQEGLFIFNPSRTISLEEFLCPGKDPETVGIYCFNIHKKLRSCILKKIKEEKISRNLIYPDVGKAMLTITKKMNSEFF